MDNEEKKSMGDWRKHFSENGSPEKAAELTAKFMFAMSYYHDRMKLHVMLHPIFFVAGFLVAYFAFGTHQ